MRRKYQDLDVVIPNKLSEKAIKEFQKVYKEVMGFDTPYDFAVCEANIFMRIFALTFPPDKIRALQKAGIWDKWKKKLAKEVKSQD